LITPDYVAIGKAALARSRARRAALEQDERNELNEKRPDLAAEAALHFVNRAGARLVRACSTCYPGLPAEARYAVLVPAPNAGVDFRLALATLKLGHYPVVARRDPLSHLPARCQHQEVR